MSHQQPHKTSALDGSLPEDLSPFEARLAGLIPVTRGVDRDEIMFQAGRNVSLQAHRRAMRRWQAACGLLLCVTIGQWAWLPSIGELPPHQQIAQETLPVQGETSSERSSETLSQTQSPQEKASPEVANTEAAQEPSANESESPSQHSRTTEEALPEPPVPSIWGLDFFVRRQSHHQNFRRDLPGRGLSVGSPPSAVWNEPATPPRASRSPAPPTPRTSRELMAEWLKQ